MKKIFALILALLFTTIFLSTQEIETYPFESYICFQDPPFETFKSIYKYDKENKLVKIEMYVFEDDQYNSRGYSDLISNTSDQIIRKDNYNSWDILSTYNTYEYNDSGLLEKKTNNNPSGGTGSYIIYQYNKNNALISQTFWGSDTGVEYNVEDSTQYFYEDNRLHKTVRVEDSWGQTFKTIEKYIYTNDLITRVNIYTNDNSKSSRYKIYSYNDKDLLDMIQYYNIDSNDKYIKGMKYIYTYYSFTS